MDCRIELMREEMVADQHELLETWCPELDEESKKLRQENEELRNFVPVARQSRWPPDETSCPYSSTPFELDSHHQHQIERQGQLSLLSYLAGPLPGLPANIVTEGPGKAEGSTTSNKSVLHTSCAPVASADMGFVRENPGETLKAQLSTLEEQLKEMHEEDSKKSDRMAVDKIQIEQLKARIAFLDREYEGSKVVLQNFEKATKQKQMLLQRALKLKQSPNFPPALPSDKHLPVEYPKRGSNKVQRETLNNQNIMSSSNNRSSIFAIPQTLVPRTPSYFSGTKEDREESMVFPFAQWWNAVPVRMKDIKTDGMPPDQRASKSQHVQLHVTIESVSHLPKMDIGLGKCDPYVTLCLFDQKFKTRIQKMTYDAKFNETFRIFVHSDSITAVKKMACDDEGAMAAGLALELECWDFDLLDADDFVGKASILLKDVLDAQDDEVLSFVRNLTLDGCTFTGEDGQQSIINISVQKKKLKRKHPEFVQPTLESIRQQSDGAGRDTALTRPSSQGVARRRNDIDVESGYEGAGSKFIGAGDRQKMAADPKNGCCSGFTKQRNDSTHYKSGAFSNDGSVEKSHAPSTLDEKSRRTHEGLDFDWREKLEIFLESLSVTVFILLLVLVDVTSLLISLFMTNGDPTYDQKVLSLCIVSCFTVEIKLRMIAQGLWRFFSFLWNVFDFLVIFASLTLSIITFLEAHIDPGLKEGSSSLRVLSRVAMALRVLRIFLQIRKVKRLQNTLSNTLRTAVSLNKRRFVENGFDLDLTYITDRVIAMSAPAIGGHSAYRNSMQTVQRFLSLRHYARFYVFNLCDTCVSSDGVMGNYHAQMLMNHVQRIPFEDHSPPLLLELIHFCRECTKWMKQDPKNVVAVHCKGGKGRTGVMIAALLLWCGHRKCAMDALELFTFRRTENYDPAGGIDASIGEEDEEEDEPTGGQKVTSIFKNTKKKPNQGVDGPSQQRYVLYVEAMLYCGVDIFARRSTWLKSIRLLQYGEKKLYLSYTVSCQRTLVFDPWSDTRQTATYGGPGQDGQELDLPAGVILSGDTKICFFLHKNFKDKQRKLFFFVIFHPAFYADTTEIVFTKNKVDMLHKDTKHKKIDADFQLTLQVSSLGSGALQQTIQSPVSPTMSNKFHQFAKPLLTMANVFRQHGDLVHYHQGDFILREYAAHGDMMFIESGIVEAVVINQMTTGDDGVLVVPEHHPCGCQIPDADSSSKQINVRIPINMVQGAGNILGLSNFLCSQHAFFFRARTDVSVYVLTKHIESDATKLVQRTPHTLTRRSSIMDGVQEDQPAGLHSAISRWSSGGAATKAWPVWKKLNAVQNAWRVLILDTAKKQITIKKHKGLENLPASVNTKITKMTQEHLLQGEGKMRRGLPVSDVIQVHYFTGDNCTKIQLSFKIDSCTAKSKFWTLAFVEPNEHDDFLNELRKVLDESHFFIHKKHKNEFTPITFEFRPTGVPEELLVDFWQGVALGLAHEVDRARTEVIRISQLKSLTDTDVLESLYDKAEQLRLECTKRFELPMNQKLVVTAKVKISYEEISKPQWLFSSLNLRMRCIILTSHIIFDQNLFGPNLSRSAHIYHVDQIHQVFHKKGNGHMIHLKVFEDDDDVQEVQEAQIAFGNPEICQEVYLLLQEMCVRATVHRAKMLEKFSILQNPCFSKMMKDGILHVLKPGQELKDASVHDSIFMVRRGEVMIRCNGLVYRSMGRGETFGEVNFVKGQSTSQFRAKASNLGAEVLELVRPVVLSVCRKDPTMHVSLWYALCKILDSSLLEIMQSTFPGTWSQYSANSVSNYSAQGDKSFQRETTVERFFSESEVTGVC